MEKQHVGGHHAQSPNEPERTPALGQRIMEQLDVDELDLLLADGFDHAFIGVGQRCGEPMIAIYDRDKAIEVLMAEGLDETQSEEHLSCNVEGAWVGPGTPMFVTLLPPS